MFTRFIIGCFFLHGMSFAYGENIDKLSTKEKELIHIEQQIKELKERRHQINLKELDQNVESEQYMIADWPTYAQELEKVHQLDVLDRQMEQEIQKLEERRAQLQQR